MYFAHRTFHDGAALAHSIVGNHPLVLNDDELVAIYRAARNLGHPFGYIVLICIHTGLRRGEVRSLKWSYVTEERITLPGRSRKMATRTRCRISLATSSH